MATRGLSPSSIFHPPSWSPWLVRRSQTDPTDVPPHHQGAGMRITKLTCLTLSRSIGLAPLAGCENLPGNKKEQGAVIGGVGGAVAGAAIAKNNRALGALIGGALGAGGGYVIGANMDKHKSGDTKSKDAAVASNDKAQKTP